MAQAANAYTKVITGLKIFLPLAALILLSTLFLFSKSNEPLRELPIAANLGDAGAIEETITGPVYSGLSSKGDIVRMTADVARPLDSGETETQNMRARIETSETTHITVTSDVGLVDENAEEAFLTGDVLIKSSDGYVLETERMRTRLDIVEAESDGAVSGHGPLGTLEAGKMLITTHENGEDVELLFTGGVKLVYLPRTEESDTQ